MDPGMYGADVLTVKPILATEVQLIGWGESPDMGAWIKLRLPEQTQLDVFRGLDRATAKRPGALFDMLLAEWTGTAESPPERHGNAAQALKLSGFARSPAVWEAVGTDADFLAWVREQPCSAPKLQPEGHRTPCGGDVVAAHVRRIASGAGMGIKNPFAAIPLCDRHHREQHARGESAVGGKDAWDRMRVHVVEAWTWQRLREAMGVSSMADCPPASLREWAEVRNVSNLLPKEYRDE